MAPRYLLADRPDGQVDAGHQHHGLEAATARRAASWRGRVVSEPSWPVFMACSMSSASPPRTSPTMMRSGRMRRALRTRSRMRDLALALDVRRRATRDVTTWSCCSCSSAASSMVTMRSSSGMKQDSTLRVVVLPVPVPPETRMFSRPLTHASRKSPTRLVSVWNADEVLGRVGVGRELADGERAGPSTESGGRMALTREPSGRRASTMGMTRRPVGPPGRRSCR